MLVVYSSSSSSCLLVKSRWGQVQSACFRDSQRASHSVRSVHSVISSVHFFRGLPLCHLPSIDPTSTVFHSRSSGIWQICRKSNNLSALNSVVSVVMETQIYVDNFYDKLIYLVLFVNREAVVESLRITSLRTARSLPLHRLIRCLVGFRTSRILWRSVLQYIIYSWKY